MQYVLVLGQAAAGSEKAATIYHLLFTDKIERRTVILQAIATFRVGKEEILPIPF